MSAPTISYSATDLDKDGVPDDVDLCPKLKEDYNPEYGNVIDGCPADFVPWYDEDYDGIQDHLDACPDLAETYNRYQDEDGCPDTVPGDEAGIPDSDGDGFPDYADNCPTQPETFRY